MNHRGIISCVLVMSLSFFSCQRKGVLPRTREQVLRVNFRSEPPTLDPRKGGDRTSSTVQFMFFEGLTRVAPDLTNELALARRVDLSQDKTVYTFHLKETRWSDGSPVTAYDFEQSWRDMLTPGFPCPNAHLLYPIKNAEASLKGLCKREDIGVVARDARTLVVELEKPTPYFLELTAFCALCPTPKRITQSNPRWADKVSQDLVCNGPFMVKSWKKDDEMIAVKNPHYWESKDVNLSKVHLSFIEDEATALQAYEKGDLDIVGTPFSELPLDAIPSLREKGLLKIEPVGGGIFCPFNVNRFPFNNLNMRRAFGYAINRKEIVDHITQLGEKVATGTLPPVMKGGKETQFFPDGDIEMAKSYFKKALDEMHLSPDRLGAVTLIYPQTASYQKIAQAVQQQWQLTLGVQIKLEGLDMRIFLDRLAKRDYQLAEFAWLVQYNDAMNILERYKFERNPKNYSGWENQDYIAALDRYLIAFTEQERLQCMEEAERIFVSDMPTVPLFHSNYACLQKDFVKGVFLSPIGNPHLRRAFLSKGGKSDGAR